MQRIHFEVGDLTRISIRATMGSTAETVLALGLLGRPGNGPHARWRNRINKRLSGSSVLSQLSLRSRGQIQVAGDLAKLVNQSLEVDELALRRFNLTRRLANAGIFEVRRAAVTPYWERIREHLEVESAARSRIAASCGIDQLLATLHSKIVWNPPVLEIPGGLPGDIELGGRGLVLAPSLFLADRPAMVVDRPHATGRMMLVFAAPVESFQSVGLPDESTHDTANALGDLLGRTRAAALRELAVSHTTTELADLLGISTAGVSQHTAILRRSGLITTHRIRNTVLHTATPLGMALLGTKAVGAAAGDDDAQPVRTTENCALEA